MHHVFLADIIKPRFLIMYCTLDVIMLGCVQLGHFLTHTRICALNKLHHSAKSLTASPKRNENRRGRQAQDREEEDAASAFSPVGIGFLSQPTLS